MPNNVEPYILYHTEGCHLCDIALALVKHTGIHFQHVDICDDDALAERYGISIPVLIQGQRELFWPFDSQQLQEFIGV
ncbi:glutaredoxin family protein [Shewanella inventionis]|uniref:Thioredoxin family protein n=1 Tax=Shewanella inventionis TaxID=1738770 RepID=A0ABQ1JAZ3_9GAMM|nr:glutaredoxin family protein [Shewanella inventionis]MCL1159755.1 glutaredoxin family protein [Shewanella inventionis]UAL42437.1 glutaredoxin family protein [Shewanella inventionis]GGB64349.1 thioredoxin family protein [Shewanella inventionis]